MENIVTKHHGALMIRIDKQSDSDFIACVNDPVEGRYILPPTHASMLEEAKQLVVTAIAKERGSDEQTIRNDLRWWKPPTQ